MTRFTRAACWAAALILLAIGDAMGLVADVSANVLFIVLPLIAWLSITGCNSCLRGPAGAIR